ncbi:hypothetical protein [Brevibacillus dissolubilis]|uniref:hypothetical protein n=1 Tax=Brevibacillus dissolubilis TaxID=1844116 RepID=UPI0011168A35|nr:hypothetical protein [Brevibacillus dissolubilis]
MDIFLSWNNRQELIQLPVLPNEFSIETGNNHETFTTEKYGEIKLIGKSKLKRCSISSFFPAETYLFVRGEHQPMLSYVETLRKWRDSSLPIRMVIPELGINIAMTIDDFTYGADRSQDVPYKLDLSEFKFLG